MELFGFLQLYRMDIPDSHTGWQSWTISMWAISWQNQKIGMCIRPVWSMSSLNTLWVAKGLTFLHADSEDSDQTGRMPRLIWVFAGGTSQFIGFVMWWLMWLKPSCTNIQLPFGPRQANLVLIAYASSEGSGEPAHPRSLARTFVARSYKQWVKRNLQTESQIPSPSEWLGMRSWNLSWQNARRHKFAWRGPF